MKKIHNKWLKVLIIYILKQKTKSYDKVEWILNYFYFVWLKVCYIITGKIRLDYDENGFKNS